MSLFLIVFFTFFVFVLDASPTVGDVTFLTTVLAAALRSLLTSVFVSEMDGPVSLQREWMSIGAEQATVGPAKRVAATTRAGEVSGLDDAREASFAE